MPKSQKPLLIVITGPTASGKSDLAVGLAKKYNGEIISADSRQIYRGLAIGSGMVPGRWSKGGFFYRGILHHLIDEIDPKQTMSVAEYQARARAIIKDIVRRGRIPILAGGTGFWIDAVAYNLALPAVRPNTRLRKDLAKKTSQRLFQMLTRLDPGRAKTIEPKNPRRLIRAIEIARALGRVPPLKKHSPYRVLWLGLNPPANILQAKIRKRVAVMIRRGLLRETKKLLGIGVSRARLREFGFEYQAALTAREGVISKRELVRRLIVYTARYARRQMTWFRRCSDIRWVRTSRDAEKIAKIFFTLDANAGKNRECFQVDSGRTSPRKKPRGESLRSPWSGA